MNFRTDLAVECHEYATKKHCEGVDIEKHRAGKVKVTTITVHNREGSRQLGKPVGRYITLEIPTLTKNAQLFTDSLETLSCQIKALLPEEGTVLVAGLGNGKITPDALGPRCVSLLLATRHISDELAKSVGLGKLRSVAALVPGVLGQTGIESAEIIKGTVKSISPSAVIVVDALAARSVSRLGCTVQLTDTGVSPGSGVGNARKEISKKTLGVPVIAIGVPTVVDTSTMIFDILEKSGMNPMDIIGESKNEDSITMVTPKEVDNMIDRAAKLVAMGINCALQPDISPEDIMEIVATP